MSAKELLQKAEALIAEAMSGDTPPTATASGTATQASVTATAPVASQPSLLETNLEAARIAAEAKQ